MKNTAKRLFLLRLDSLVDAGMKSITVQRWQFEFLDGLTQTSSDTTTYRGVPLRIIDDHPGPTTLAPATER